MPLRVNPHGFFFSSTPTSPHLLLFSPSIPLFLPSLMRAKPRFARFLLFGQRLAIQQPRCASRGLCEVKEAVPVPIRGVISDGQQTIRQAVARGLPGVPHQLCHFHYLDEAADPIFEADRHAKTELKKLVRGVRPIERSLEGGEDEQTDVMRSYCLAVRSALTDDGHPPLCASGLKLHDRLTQISDSLARVEAKKGAFLQPCTTFTISLHAL